MPRWTLVATVFVALATAPPLAAAQHAANAPALKVGDAWTMDFPNFGGLTTRTIIAIASDGAVTVTDNGEFGLLTRRITKEWNPIGGDDLDSRGLIIQATYTPPPCWYRFPLTVGKEWRCDYTYSSGEFQQAYHYAAKVVGFGPVKTQAGTFQAFRIETNANGATGTNWYAPSVRAYVKFESDALSKYNSELVKYTLK